MQVTESGTTSPFERFDTPQKFRMTTLLVVRIGHLPLNRGVLAVTLEPSGAARKAWLPVGPLADPTGRRGVSATRRKESVSSRVSESRTRILWYSRGSYGLLEYGCCRLISLIGTVHQVTY